MHSRHAYSTGVSNSSIFGRNIVRGTAHKWRMGTSNNGPDCYWLTDITSRSAFTVT